MAKALKNLFSGRPTFHNPIYGESLYELCRRATSRHIDFPDDLLNQQIVHMINEERATPMAAADAVACLRKRLNMEHPQKQFLAVVLTGKVLREAGPAVGPFTEDLLREIASVAARPSYNSPLAMRAKQTAIDTLRDYGQRGQNAFRQAATGPYSHPVYPQGPPGIDAGAPGAVGAAAAAGQQLDPAALAAQRESLLDEIQRMVHQAHGSCEVVNEMLGAEVKGDGKEFERDMVEQLTGDLAALRDSFNSYLEQLGSLHGGDAEEVMAKALDAVDMLDRTLARASEQREKRLLAGPTAAASGSAGASGLGATPRIAPPGGAAAAAVGAAAGAAAVAALASGDGASASAAPEPAEPPAVESEKPAEEPAAASAADQLATLNLIDFDDGPAPAPAVAAPAAPVDPFALPAVAAPAAAPAAADPADPFAVLASGAAATVPAATVPAAAAPAPTAAAADPFADAAPAWSSVDGGATAPPALTSLDSASGPPPGTPSAVAAAAAQQPASPAVAAAAAAGAYPSMGPVPATMGPPQMPYPSQQPWAGGYPAPYGGGYGGYAPQYTGYPQTPGYAPQYTGYAPAPGYAPQPTGGYPMQQQPYMQPAPYGAYPQPGAPYGAVPAPQQQPPASPQQQQPFGGAGYNSSNPFASPTPSGGGAPPGAGGAAPAAGANPFQQPSANQQQQVDVEWDRLFAKP